MDERKIRSGMGALFVAALFSLSACGSDSPAVERAIPTQPSARFAMPTTMITPTPVTEAAATTEASEESEAAAPVAPAATPEIDLARGQTAYVNRGCAECHGEQGEGLPDKGATLASTELTLSEFTEWLRTGGKGQLGNDHIFGPSAISPGGMTALHAWLQSLPAPD